MVTTWRPRRGEAAAAFIWSGRFSTIRQARATPRGRRGNDPWRRGAVAAMSPHGIERSTPMFAATPATSIRPTPRRAACRTGASPIHAREVALEGRRVLDVGCGDELYSHVSSSAPPRHLVGVDAAAQAIATRRNATVAAPALRFERATCAAAGRWSFDVAVVRAFAPRQPSCGARSRRSAARRQACGIEPNGYNPS
jgi:hypothetical protein